MCLAPGYMECRQGVSWAVHSGLTLCRGKHTVGSSRGRDGCRSFCCRGLSLQAPLGRQPSSLLFGISLAQLPCWVASLCSLCDTACVQLASASG
jgi:hypothetical protein